MWPLRGVGLLGLVTPVRADSPAPGGVLMPPRGVTACAVQMGCQVAARPGGTGSDGVACARQAPCGLVHTQVSCRPPCRQRMSPGGVPRRLQHDGVHAIPNRRKSGPVGRWMTRNVQTWRALLSRGPQGPLDKSASGRKGSNACDGVCFCWCGVVVCAASLVAICLGSGFVCLSVCLAPELRVPPPLFVQH